MYSSRNYLCYIGNETHLYLKMKAFTKIKRWYEKYERYLIPGALVSGFLFDVFTFKSIDLSTALLVLMGHLILSISAITFINAYDDEVIKGGKFMQYTRLFAPLLLQYTFGALLSGSLIFYGFAGSLSVSWPLLLIIVFLMISNDLLRKYYLRLPVQMGVYFFILFSYLALALPFILKDLGVLIFIASGISALFLIWLYLRVFSPRIPQLKKKVKIVSTVIFCVFAGMNILYFTNTIPPVPLTMRDSGVYYLVERDHSSGQYRVVGGKQTFWDKFRLYPHTVMSSEIYVFTSVFAPTNLETNIIHKWQYQSPETKRWETIESVTFPIVGGRDAGYRGYTRTTRTKPGLWRVSVETPSGQVLGVVRFELVEKRGSVPLEMEWK